MSRPRWVDPSELAVNQADDDVVSGPEARLDAHDLPANEWSGLSSNSISRSTAAKEFMRRAGLPDAEQLLDRPEYVEWRGGRAHTYAAVALFTSSGSGSGFVVPTRWVTAGNEWGGVHRG